MFFFFNDTATTEIYTDGHTLSLHDALPIYQPEDAAQRVDLQRPRAQRAQPIARDEGQDRQEPDQAAEEGDLEAVEPVAQQLDQQRHEGEADAGRDHPDRKSTRLNSSH